MAFENPDWSIDFFHKDEKPLSQVSIIGLNEGRPYVSSGGEASAVVEYSQVSAMHMVPSGIVRPLRQRIFPVMGGYPAVAVDRETKDEGGILLHETLLDRRQELFQ